MFGSGGRYTTCRPEGWWDWEGQQHDESEHEGPTGNEDAPMSRWHRRAALVLWPWRRRLQVVGPVAAVSSLRADLDGEVKDDDEFGCIEDRAMNAVELLARERISDVSLVVEAARCLLHPRLRARPSAPTSSAAFQPRVSRATHTRWQRPRPC